MISSDFCTTYQQESKHFSTPISNPSFLPIVKMPTCKIYAVAQKGSKKCIQTFLISTKWYEIAFIVIKLEEREDRGLSEPHRKRGKILLLHVVIKRREKKYVTWLI